MDGLEPAEKGSELGEYRVANEKGTKNEKGYIWSKGPNGGYWKPGPIISAANGVVTRDAAQRQDAAGTLQEFAFGDTPPPPNINIARKRLVDDNTYLEANMRAGIHLGTFATDGAEGERMLNHFFEGNGANLNFTESSTLSREMRSDPRFLTFARAFEATALTWYRAHGTIENFRPQFHGRPNFGGITDNLYLATLIGGTHGFSAQIRSITSKQIVVRYAIHDIFSAGTDDAARIGYLGLQSMFILQRYRNVTPTTAHKYKPFFLSVQITRTRAPNNFQ